MKSFSLIVCLTLLLANSFAQPLPLKVKEHYLVDANYKAFLYHTDTGWQLPWKLSRQETADYLADRKRRGFTAIQLQMLPHRLNQTNTNGHNPFQQLAI